ncbi:1,6-anhydro-N-acetylmuramyl-L-alanine amidase AmpD [Catenovulum sp. 2E275]|uniref:1,6-anhydro-N-acetylmuramyl-L-alanine amidase AmpD n=1 Tax=Catenovulum sp. 2E275 TaxID=2980497 RepID=UPI0021D1D03E|nr:1,6-anhydro-N-acetylmuramyl-L-alanine amidase AmpD [Catenovulum sp. 2E275]MCU4677611.1 1,6-anhydro-N-acetylmuramyl-L-alanine amidase AmpD [Catenovulum sp. 2E275]
MSIPTTYKIINHQISGVEFRPSSHFNQRPDPKLINLLVIHCISLPAKQFGLNYIDDLFLGCLDCNADSSFQDLQGLRVSAHLLIKRTGEVIQYVPFDKRAWHAGVSSFEGVENCNDYSIGIELEGADDIVYETIQYQTLAAVCQQIQQTYPAITQARIVGHCDIAPGRKTDPGPAFNWQHLYNLINQNKGN